MTPAQKTEMARKVWALREENPRIPEHIARAVNKHVFEIAALLNLSDWMIVVNDDPPVIEGVAASINSRTGTKVAGVWLSDRFLDINDPTMSDFIRSQVLVHEVLHLHFEEVWNFMDDVFDHEFAGSARKMVDVIFKRHLEVAVDQLASALVHGLPKFVWPREPKPAK